MDNVMGAGLAKQVATRYPNIPNALGWLYKSGKHNCHVMEQLKLIFFPVKPLARNPAMSWSQPASLSLIEESARDLGTIVLTSLVVVPHVGCGNGGLDWNEVKPILDKYLDHRFLQIDPL